MFASRRFPGGGTGHRKSFFSTNEKVGTCLLHGLLLSGMTHRGLTFCFPGIDFPLSLLCAQLQSLLVWL